jgi:hypothetical protein
MTTFTIKAGQRDRIWVGWQESDDVELHFIAPCEGDELADPVEPILRLNRAATGRGPARGLSRHDAKGPDFAPIVAEARALIARDRLATKARAIRAAEIADAEEAAITAKAKAVREALAPMGVDLGKLPNVDLATAYDRIQNRAI